ncbi:MAG: hypothetical protein DYG94_05810 [Leptolyngbya sp. PLA3]|nr:MAG: hypothetical protein EDM82_04310 [Cyanobacteria bacterium CYA]MCE7968247.1 hypothetical protein [Leptolyngbya sp. PL-A3]
MLKVVPSLVLVSLGFGVPVQAANVAPALPSVIQAAAWHSKEGADQPETTPRESAGGIFTAGSKLPERVVFAVGPDAFEGVALGTEMGRALAGVLDERAGAGVPVLLANLVERGTRVREEATIAWPVCVAWVFAGGQSKRVEIGRTEQGWLLARELDFGQDGPDLARLNERRFELLSAAWPALRVPFGQAAKYPAGELVALEQPYVAGEVVLDEPTLRRRLFHNPGDTALLDRNLAEERFFVRMPGEREERRPCGLLVWIHAIDAHEPPLEVIAPVCDELGLAIVSIADAGNAREVVDRLQLVLDVVATVSARVPIDERRVYATGISGGGRCSSIVWGCFPDVFTGAAPIVGLDSYQVTPTGTGRAWRQSYDRPGGSLFSVLRTHRMAGISGENDGNFAEMKARLDLLSRDGMDVRLVEQPGMGHEMPAPETFAQAMRWVDEPAREAMAKAGEEGAQLLRRAHAAEGEARERLLMRVIETAPWSDAAWEAIDLLRNP